MNYPVQPPSILIKFLMNKRIAPLLLVITILKIYVGIWAASFDSPTAHLDVNT